MRVVMDARAIVTSGGGLRTYSVELAGALARAGVDLTLWYSALRRPAVEQRLRAELPEPALSLAGSCLPNRCLYSPAALAAWSRWPRWLPPPRLLPRAGDLYHAIHWPLPLDRRPLVLTIHDLVGLCHPDWVPPLVLAVHRAIAALAPRAAQVIADSAFTRDHVLELTGLPADRVTVVPLGVAPRFSAPPEPAVAARLGLARPYLLALGTIEPRRNVAGLIEAYDLLPAAVAENCELALVGERIGDAGPVDALLARARPGRVRWLGRLADTDLPPLLAGAAAFAHLSLFEGFGLPPLEAMAAGAPVVCSSATSLPEVVGDAGLLVDPRNREEVAAALETVLTDTALATDLRRRGRERAANFTWEAAAAATVEVYRRAMS